VRFTVAALADGTVIIDEVADNDQDLSDPDTMGQVSYTLQAGDTDTPGHYIAEWEVEFQNGAIQSFPNGGYVSILITEQLAGGVVYS
jgi:hypothetical protein